AERRPITVMFCDLVGSTELAAALDVEDWRNLLNSYLDEASRAVTALGGHVLKTLGDGLMAVFGYPQVQENDAERAVRAALAIQRALAELNARNARSGAPELSARIGLESGRVVIDASGEVFGEAPNIAARVQAAADPGTVLVTASVNRQTAGLFVAEDKGQHDFKGLRQPVALYRIVRASGGGRRGRSRALCPLVGRSEELDLLARRWEQARSGHGQFVQIVGEPGLGKSRLIEEFRARLGETPHTWVEWSSSQLLQNSPLHPIAEWGRLRFGADLTAEQRLADLENTLQLVGLDAAEYAPLIAPLVYVPFPEDRRAKFAPEELQRRQLAAMTALVLAGARSQPAVVAFEDLHWADPTSLDLLRALSERGAHAPLLILATTRPEFRPPWSVRSHHSVIALAPLDRAQVAKMVGELASRHALSKDVIEGVNERTGGVPLFVEEVTRLLLERGVEGGAETIPPTLQQSLAARLDALGPAREAAQIGAVLGRSFSYALLREVASVAAVADRGSAGLSEAGYRGLDEAGLESALERLAEADILIAEGAGPQANYRFKHALIQEAAYESLLRSRRKTLHRRAAEILLGQPERAAAEPEAIARHFTKACLDELAIEWWAKAGDHALRRSAIREAIAHLGKAIEMADRTGATARSATGDSAAPNRRLTQLHLAYGNALIAARGHGALETTAAFARARELSSGVEIPAEQFSIYYGLWAGSFVRGGELRVMREISSAAVELAERYPGTGEAAMAHRMRGMTYWYQGDYTNARVHLERALAMFDPERDCDLAFRFGQDIGVSFMNYLALALWPIGEIRRAQELESAALARADRIGHVATLAYAASYRSIFEMMRLDARVAEPYAAQTLELGRLHGLSLSAAYAAVVSAWTRARLGDRGQGAAQMRQGLDNLRQHGFTLITPLFHALLADLEVESGEIDSALGSLDRTLAEIERTEHRTFDAEIHRIRGKTMLKRNPANTSPAEEAFQTAIAIARKQGSRSFGLRAALRSPVCFASRLMGPIMPERLSALVEPLGSH
ncbi:MAG TPA: AAA family ATPase, partial [Roseiarcus sp.]|nr:AAA family ATPase [Roseiarcus sp.]